MSAVQRSEPTGADFGVAKDAGFRARAVFEYERIAAWIGRSVDLGRARILDFGCGQGIAAASFALRHPGSDVVGLDIEPVRTAELAAAYTAQIGCALPPNVSFGSMPSGELPDGAPFDLIYAWSVFEHVPEHGMVDLFRSLRKRLAKGGRLFIQADPLYFSPRGSRLYNYYRSPWHHLILPLDVLREGVLSDQPTAKETREWSQFLALNRLTAPDMIARAREAGLTLVRHAAFQTDIVPPPRLTRIYNRDALVTHEFMALFE